MNYEKLNFQTPVGTMGIQTAIAGAATGLAWLAAITGLSTQATVDDKSGAIFAIGILSSIAAACSAGSLIVALIERNTTGYQDERITQWKESNKFKVCTFASLTIATVFLGVTSADTIGNLSASEEAHKAIYHALPTTAAVLLTFATAACMASIDALSVGKVYDKTTRVFSAACCQFSCSRPADDKSKETQTLLSQDKREKNSQRSALPCFP